MEENKRISDLFDRARNEAPKTSFVEVKKHFLAAGAVGGTSLFAKWLASSFKFKAIVMIATLSTLTISAILVATQLTSSAQTLEVKADQNMKTGANNLVINTDNVEISNQNGIQKTVIFDENDRVLKVVIDSTNKTKAKATKIELSTKEPELISGKFSVENQLIKLKKNAPITLVSNDSLTKKEFTITEKTTNAEIEKMQQQAIAAGLEFNYDTKIRSNTIKRLNLQMKMKSDRWTSKITGTNSFSFDFGWWEDADGKFVKFISDHELTSICGKC